MRKTLVRYSIKERMNDILGTDEGSGFTAWSVQESVNENSKRVIKGIVGESTLGKVMTGLRVSSNSIANVFSVSAGYCFNYEGEVIKLSVAQDIYHGYAPADGDIFRVYIKYEEAVVNSDDLPNGHSSPLVGEAESVDIIEDGIGANDEPNGYPGVSAIFEVEQNLEPTSTGNRVYLGYVKYISASSIEIRSEIDKTADVNFTFTQNINMTGTANGTSADWNRAIFAYNNEESEVTLTNYPGVITLPEGKNIIKKIEVSRRVRSTNQTPRPTLAHGINPPENFKARLSMRQVGSSGSLMELANFSSLDLDDTIEGYTVQSFDLDYYLDESIKNITLKSETTGDDETSASPWTFASSSGGNNEMFYYTNYGPANVLVTIENLKD